MWVTILLSSIVTTTLYNKYYIYLCNYFMILLYVWSNNFQVIFVQSLGEKKCRKVIIAFTWATNLVAGDYFCIK